MAVILYKSTLVLRIFSTENPEFQGTHMDHPTPGPAQQPHHMPSNLNI